ncbi:MAG: Exonuclease SbcC, partial [Myxococcaceae bacterium]|nr:Exonuclease SbcC [Myxococcaceae bacterium]
GEISSALEALRTAALTPDSDGAPEEVYALALARFARLHDFTEELVEASERLAARLGAELHERERDNESDPQLIERLRSRALAYWHEAARLRCTSLSDPLGALKSIESALAEVPGDPLFTSMRMLAYDLLEDRERAASEARALLTSGMNGEQSAALHFRLAEHALVKGNAESARNKLLETIETAGGSVAAEAMLDDLLIDEARHAERVLRREVSANTSSAENARAELAEAAQIAAQELRDPARALSLYTRADALLPADRTLLQEAYGSALELADAALARFALERLPALELTVEERAALLLHGFELAVDDERDALIDGELARSEPSAALLKLAVSHTAVRHDHARLMRVHEARASQLEGEEAASELCAAARVALRTRDLPHARALLERALVHAPAQPYALTLLEEVLREQGDSAAAITLLRGAAERHLGQRDKERHLLSAGAAAEAAGDTEGATQSYLEAATQQEPSLGALWALQRLAQKKQLPKLEQRARKGLADRERLQQRAGVDTLLLAEHLDLVDQQPGEAEALLQLTLEDEDIGHHAAVALALSRSAPLALRAQALELLATRATDSLRPALLRELGGALAARGAPHAKVLDLVERVGRARHDDRWAAWTRTHTGLSLRESQHARALATFAEVTTDPQIASIARAEALWAKQVEQPARPLAESLFELIPGDLPLSVELAEVVIALGTPQNDGVLRTQALDLVAKNADPEMRPSALLALARARLAQNDPIGALLPIEEVISRKPQLLAAWELAHVAARQANKPALLADAAEKLAESVDGELALELYEESATVRMDELDDSEGAERLFAQVLSISPRRTHAYERLHDLLLKRDALDRLTALLRRRLQLIDHPEDLIRLYYELGRHERKRGELAAALEALDNVLMLDDEHLGALGLSAEIQTARGNFQEAVVALDRLASATSLPKPQRRLAALGAADFLEHKLDDRAGALARLEQLVILAPDEAKLQVRLADLAERHGQFERSATALERAVELESDEALRISLSVRLGDVLAQKLARKLEAVSAYRRALEWAPDHVDAARSLLAITPDDEVLARLELEVRSRARDEPRDPAVLRKLHAVARLMNDSDLAFIALSGLQGLAEVQRIGTLSDDERKAFLERERSARKANIAPGVVLSDGELRAFLAPSLDGRAQQLLSAVFSSSSSAIELDGLEPARFGVGRAQRLNTRDPHAVRDDLRALAAPLGLILGEVYVGGSVPLRIAALPREGELGFVIGSEVASPLIGEARHAAALQLAATCLDSLPLLCRSADEAARVVYAALASEDCPLPRGIDRAALGDLPRSVGKALPRKAKRALPELLRALPEHGAELPAQCRALLARTRRLALLLSGELPAALREAQNTTDADLDLLRTWTGSAMSSSRRKLGLAQ